MLRSGGLPKQEGPPQTYMYGSSQHFMLPGADAAPTQKLAASIAVGLVNQKYKKPMAVTLNSPNDWKWVDNIRLGAELRQRRWVKASIPDIIAYAVSIGKF